MSQVAKNISYAYAMFRPWDGTVCYIGKGVRNRWLEHEKLGVNHYNKRLAKIFAKTEVLGLDIIKVKFRENLTDAEAIQIEIAFIKAIGREDLGTGLLVNGTDGGEGWSGPKSKEHRAAIGMALKNKPKSEAACAAMKVGAAARWGRDEERKKFRDYHSNMTIEEKAARNTLISKRTKEAMIDSGASEKISLSKLNKPHSEERKKQNSIAVQKAYRENPEYRLKLIKGRRGLKPALGMIHSAATRLQMSNSHKLRNAIRTMPSLELMGMMGFGS